MRLRWRRPSSGWEMLPGGSDRDGHSATHGPRVTDDSKILVDAINETAATTMFLSSWQCLVLIRQATVALLPA